MNEQIEYLFDQALEEFKAENKHVTVVVPVPLQRDFVEKFAKLIVRECAKRVDYWESRQGEHTEDLLKQFGVTE
jgi:hypothetical protein